MLLQIVRIPESIIWNLRLTDHHPAEASGVMNLRKAEGPLGTVDLPALETTRERVAELMAEVPRSLH